MNSLCKQWVERRPDQRVRGFTLDGRTLYETPITDIKYINGGLPSPIDEFHM